MLEVYVTRIVDTTEKTQVFFRVYDGTPGFVLDQAGERQAAFVRSEVLEEGSRTFRARQGHERARLAIVQEVAATTGGEMRPDPPTREN